MREHLMTAAEFYSANPRRMESEQWDHGHWYEGSRHAQVTWLESTGEACAVFGHFDEGETYEVLGLVASYDLLEALLADGHEHERSLSWARGQIQHAPTGDVADALVAAHVARLAAEADEQERREALSFEVVNLDDLPAVPDELAERYEDSDWPAIAELAVRTFESGVSARDLTAIGRVGAESQLSPSDQRAFSSLFFDPIVVRPGGDHYTNGRHRVAAMRRAGVVRCVVHTYAGYPSAD